MTKHEWRKNDEAQMSSRRFSIRLSGFLRHSCLVIRHSSQTDGHHGSLSPPLHRCFDAICSKGSGSIFRLRRYTSLGFGNRLVNKGGSMIGNRFRDIHGTCRDNRAYKTVQSNDHCPVMRRRCVRSPCYPSRPPSEMGSLELGRPSLRRKRSPEPPGNPNNSKGRQRGVVSFPDHGGA
jgi:hypothetical protein